MAKATIVLWLSGVGSDKTILNDSPLVVPRRFVKDAIERLVQATGNKGSPVAG